MKNVITDLLLETANVINFLRIVPKFYLCFIKCEFKELSFLANRLINVLFCILTILYIAFNGDNTPRLGGRNRSFLQEGMSFYCMRSDINFQTIKLGKLYIC